MAEEEEDMNGSVILRGIATFVRKTLGGGD